MLCFIQRTSRYLNEASIVLVTTTPHTNSTGYPALVALRAFSWELIECSLQQFPSESWVRPLQPRNLTRPGGITSAIASGTSEADRHSPQLTIPSPTPIAYNSFWVQSHVLPLSRSSQVILVGGWQTFFFPSRNPTGKFEGWLIFRQQNQIWFWFSGDEHRERMLRGDNNVYCVGYKFTVIWRWWK